MSPTIKTTSSWSNFEAFIEPALVKYIKRTGRDLRNHELAAIIDRCKSSDAILAVFQEQSQLFDESRNGKPQLIKWLKPIVNGLHAISANAVIGSGASFALPPAKIIFSAIGVLLATAKYVRQSYDSLVEVFECIENLTSRLKIYADIQPTPAMTETIMKIMVDLLSVLALATKEMNQGRLRTCAKRLLGENKVKAVLQRLDRLTLEESKMTVAQTLEVICGLVSHMETVMEGGKTTTDDIQQTLVLMQEITMKVNKLERDQWQNKFRRWLSPPDPWSNHKIARDAHHRGTATWFTQGETFAQWKSTGSLLWINGLPGSGKTVMSSSIIEELEGMRRTGLSTLSVFYCDFRDTNKQNARNMLSSILIQLCHQSDRFSQLLSFLYVAHGDGSREPSIDALLEILKTMLVFRGQGTHYVVLDALDECPSSSGHPTHREQVLRVLKELLDLRLPQFRICVASRPEIDIRGVLEPLNPYSVSLHNQDGQKKDLAEYIKSVVHSDEIMQIWPEDVKELVVDTLAEKGGGIFQWAYCQLEILRRCPLRNIPSTLIELPQTLDETYERILQGIPKKMRQDAHRIFQWLTTSSRPLFVDEVAEVFVIDFETETSGIPKYDTRWRPENAEAIVLSACSTLVSVDDEWKVVHLSHFSVKEYLTSDRIANSALVPHFHILPKSAHTLLAKACLSVLLQLDDSVDKVKIQNFPLAEYAAEHWIDHARFEGVSSDIRDAMDYFFDSSKPHFAIWSWIFDFDILKSHLWDFDDFDDSDYFIYSSCSDYFDAYAGHPGRPNTAPLYYAALCGFCDLAERLLDASPQDLNSRGGYYETPFHAALNKGYPNIALLLLERGADVGPRAHKSQTALYLASSRGYVDVLRLLISRGADPNEESDGKDTNYADKKDDEDDVYDVYHGDVKQTPLLVASKNGRLDIARVLLDHGAQVNFQDKHGRSPLHVASCLPSNCLARLLLDHGANINAPDILGDTALHKASSLGRIAVATLLLEYGASVDARCNEGWTPLHEAARWGHPEIVQLLLSHGASANVQAQTSGTTLHVAARFGCVQVVEVLLKHGADPLCRNYWGKTPYQLASEEDHQEIMRVLSKCTSERM